MLFSIKFLGFEALMVARLSCKRYCFSMQLGKFFKSCKKKSCFHHMISPLLFPILPCLALQCSVTSESKKPRQIAVVITTAICLFFFDSDVSLFIMHWKLKPWKAYSELPVSQFSQGKTCVYYRDPVFVTGITGILFSLQGFPCKPLNFPVRNFSVSMGLNAQPSTLILNKVY